MVQTKISGLYQEKVVFTSNAVRTTLLVQTTCSWIKPEIQVQTSQSGVNHEAGSYHYFLVCTSKVVQTTKQWYEPSVVQTTLGWFRPLFLVQTTKTWSNPIFFRLLRSLVYKYNAMAFSAGRGLGVDRIDRCEGSVGPRSPALTYSHSQPTRETGSGRRGHALTHMNSQT